MINKLKFLLGNWKGEGHAAYPTINSADYTEELTFESCGEENKIEFNQKTLYKNESRHLHREYGFILEKEKDVFTFINAQNNGRTEVLKGVLEAPTKLVLDSTHYGNDERPVKTRREYYLEKGLLHYKLFLQTQNQPYQLHLEAKLSK
ncbi:MAG: FABP family protein [Bacteroidetes bacterium]|nr:FABP family protein [Bacteroidota bacterium]